MKPIQCVACQGRDLYQPETGGDEGVTLRPVNPFSQVWPPFQTSVKLRFVVCLSCGFVTPHVDDDGLARIRSWHAKEEPPAKPKDAGDEI